MTVETTPMAGMLVPPDTTKDTPLLVCPPTETVTGPETAPLGTVTVNWDAWAETTVAVTARPEKKETVFLDGVVENPEPLI